MERGRRVFHGKRPPPGVSRGERMHDDGCRELTVKERENRMPKPETIDRHRCRGKDKEEKYKDFTALDYWWGLRELAADFDIDNYRKASGGEIGERHSSEIAYIQLLHYTVEVKLSGAWYQMEHMERLFGAPLSPGSSLDLRVLEAKEAFDAVHEDLYQAFCAIANQIYMLFNRPGYTPVKVDRKRPVAMSPSDLRYWLNLNKHPSFRTLSNIFIDCEKQLDIRHHATHYGAVPVYADKETGVLYLQRDFRIGELLTKYDVVRYMKSGKPMANLLEAARPRVKGMCACINRVYRHLYLGDFFERFLEDRGLAIRDDYKPYWEQEAPTEDTK
jgi:hypothetical protein